MEDSKKRGKIKKHTLPNNKQNTARAVLTNWGRDNHAGRIGGNQTREGLLRGLLRRRCLQTVRDAGEGAEAEEILRPEPCLRANSGLVRSSLHVSP